ncbi:hypothetical protein TorRG33x02_156040 [Trema orientale]|uniref:Uncharacterized protein n=1 Tax=Trema orientale TaxID=63057 RepID=A0A2P5ESL1_TREOI|nr:hypothetical protein TorRG33x02_156040 [Trema orientale]
MKLKVSRVKVLNKENSEASNMPKATMLVSSTVPVLPLPESSSEFASTVQADEQAKRKRKNISIKSYSKKQRVNALEGFKKDA